MRLPLPGERFAVIRGEQVIVYDRPGRILAVVALSELEG